MPFVSASLRYPSPLLLPDDGEGLDVSRRCRRGYATTTHGKARNDLSSNLFQHYMFRVKRSYTHRISLRWNQICEYTIVEQKYVLSRYLACKRAGAKTEN